MSKLLLLEDDLSPISARVRRRQNCMTLLCIIFAVFLVTAIFSVADMDVRMEQARLAEKHGQDFSFGDVMGTAMGQTLLLTGIALFVLILLAGVLMISGSINSTVAQRTKFFGMMRCIGMSRQQLKRFVRLEALNWCKTAIPIGVALVPPQSVAAADITITDEAGVTGINCISPETVETIRGMDGRFPYAVWTIPVFRLLIVVVFVAAATLAAIHAPAKRMQEMAVTETINEL